ncbi:MAG TPA: pilus assembly protein TadG-related protein [Terriglobia bacterium]|nr:pilus assembly protein TadG-related protein [Terriglobia bacterium]
MESRLRLGRCVPIFQRSARQYSEDGQVSILVVLAVGLFLIIFVGFGVDMTNLFLHRQMSQNAADSACVAAAMDMEKQRVNGQCLTAAGTAYPCGNFTVGTNFDCATTPGAAPCQYAALNGYSGASAGIPAAGVESNSVQVTFLTGTPGIPGVATPDISLTGLYPFVKVDVYDGVKVYFSSWLSHSSTQVVHALAKCGLQASTQPIPILVLDPTDPKSFQVSGAATVTILGGPNRSIQVNSDATAGQASGNAAYLGGSGGSTACGNAQVDLCHGGIDFGGSDFGVTGGPPPTPSTFATQSPFGWRAHVVPLQDPFITLPPPPDPGTTSGNGTPVPYGTNGCPDATIIPPGGTVPGCIEYVPGYYKGGINVTNYTAIFDPGVYYIEGGALELHSNSLVRPSTAIGDSSQGTIFYLTCTNPGSCTSGNVANILVGANAGGNVADKFVTSRVHCPGDAPFDGRAGVPPTVDGNVLMAPCTTLGTYVGGLMPNVGTPDTVGSLRGILFFGDRSAGAQETMNGGGGLLLTGTMYFRDCPSLLTTGTCRNPPADYQTVTTMTGGSGSNTRVYGQIVTDQLTMTGNSAITMDLNPWTRPILKVQLLQ